MKLKEYITKINIYLGSRMKVRDESDPIVNLPQGFSNTGPHIEGVGDDIKGLFTSLGNRWDAFKKEHHLE